MLAQLTRRIVAFVVSVFAMLGFLAVPLGEKTGFQHVRAIVSSEEAGHFGRALRNAVAELGSQLRGELDSRPASQPPERQARDAGRSNGSTSMMSSRPAPNAASGKGLGARLDPIPWCAGPGP